MAGIIDLVATARWALRPAHALRYLVAASVVATIACVVLALRLPLADVAFVHDVARDSVEVRTAQADFAVTPDARIRLEFSGGTTLAFPAAMLADRDQADRPDRLALAAGLQNRGATAHFVDSAGALHHIPVSRRPATLSDLNAGFWLTLACGLFGLLFGLGAWAVRPGDWAARFYALAAFGLYVTSASDATGEVWNIATDRDAIDPIMAVNIGALHFFTLAFLALFLRFPKPLLTNPAALGALAVTSGAIVVGMAAVGNEHHQISAGIQLAEYAVMSFVVGAQIWVGRRERASRLSLAIMIVAIVLGIVLYMLVTVLPTLLGLPGILSENVTLPLFMLVHAGIGAAIVRAGLFMLDRLTRSIMISICLAAVVLLIDIALVGWLTRQSDVALGLAIAAVALGYLPTREWLLRRSERRREEQARRSLHLATGLAFAPDEPTRAVRWRAAIEATFEPLEIEVDPDPSREPSIGDRGLTLRLPAVAGAPGLLCRHANAGQRPFVPGDVEAALALITIVDRLVEARDAYTQGASEERRRIARDLHDDVSGRLMTSLHRDDAQAMRHDVREAMADIRVIVNGLIAEPRALGEILADIRHEAQLRLASANVALRWRAGPELGAREIVAYPVYRHIISVVREGVSNIVRHANAATAEIGVVLAEDLLTVSIADDGRGIDPRAERGNGLGNCARRAAELSGDFEILPTQVGTAIRFRIKLFDAGTPAKAAIDAASPSVSPP